MLKIEFLHIRENNEESEKHLNSHVKKFQSDANFVFMLLRNGRKLTDKILMQEFGISGRRLREIYELREEIKRKFGWEIKKEWIKDGTGNTSFVQYWAVAPHPQTKSELQQFWDDFQNEQPPKTYYQPSLPL